jgi:hypothetical protein
MRRMLFTVFVGAALAAVASACNRTGAEPDAAALTSEPFFLRGTINETGQPGGFLMTGEPGSSYKTDKAYFRVGSDRGPTAHALDYGTNRGIVSGAGSRAEDRDQVVRYAAVRPIHC